MAPKATSGSVPVNDETAPRNRTDMSIDVHHRYLGELIGEFPRAVFEYAHESERGVAVEKAREFIAMRPKREDSEYVILDVMHSEHEVDRVPGGRTPPPKSISSPQQKALREGG